MLPAAVARPVVAPTLASSRSEKPSSIDELVMVSATSAGAASPTRRLPRGTTSFATSASARRNTVPSTVAEASKTTSPRSNRANPDVPAPLDASNT